MFVLHLDSTAGYSTGYMPRDGKIDQFDLKILGALVEDGRMTLTRLAETVGLSKTPCQVRLKRLIDRGIISGFRAVVDPATLGIAHVTFTEVSLDDTSEAALARFNAAALNVPEIEECHLIAGAFDYLLKVRTADIAAYRRVLGEDISNLPHVASSSTYVAMETVLESGRSPIRQAIARQTSAERTRE